MQVKTRVNTTTLVDKGLELMYLRGYHDVSVKDLVDAVGMPKGSFYNHFKSKEAFGLAVVDRYSELWHKDIKRFLADRTKPAFVRFESFFDFMFVTYGSDWNFSKGCLAGNFSQEMADVNDLFAQRVDTAFRIARSYFALAVQDGQRDGSVDPKLDPEATAEYLLNSFEGAMLRMKSARSAEPLEAFKALVFATIVKK